MDRKWGKINLDVKTKYEIKRERNEKIDQLLCEHRDVKYIAKTLGVCKGVVYKRIKEYGIQERNIHN